MTVQRFGVGDRVRVRAGVTDPDFPSLSLAGWAGTVREVDADSLPTNYLVAWNEQTLAAAPRKFRRRCDVAGLEVETIWLHEADLEPDVSDQLFVPPPPPLDLDDPEDRARSVLGVSSDDELPAVTLERLALFRRYLEKSLKFPFPAGLDLGETQLGSGLRPVMVLRILPAERSLPVVGLMAEVALEESRAEVPLAVLEPAEAEATQKDLSAYVAWIGAHLPPPPARRAPTHPFVLLGILLALMGGVVGAVVEAVPGAELGALIGAALVGSIGFFVGVWYERMFRLGSRLPPGFFGGAVIGLLGGACVGAAIGAVSLAYLGSIPGAIVGGLVGRLLGRLRLPRFGPLAMTFCGAGAGALVLTLLTDWGAALRGLGYGLLVGVLAAVVVIGGAMAYLTVVFRFEDGEG